MSLNIQQVPPLFPSSPLPEFFYLTTLQLLSQQIELQYHLELLYMYKMCALSYILVLGFFSWTDLSNGHIDEGYCKRLRECHLSLAKQHMVC